MRRANRQASFSDIREALPRTYGDRETFPRLRLEKPESADVGAGPVGDERSVTKAEAWMKGLTITDCREFRDGTGQRWRQLTLSNGSVVQIVLTHSWLIIS